MLDISLHPLLYPICRDMDHNNNSYASNSLPTPPSSVPSRSRTNNSHHLALPPITHLQHFNRPCPSPLTPPDDDMNATQIPWRDSKPGPSRLHSPVTTAYTSPLSSSPSPSPMDEERDSVSYPEQDDLEVDEGDEDEDEDEVEPEAEPKQYHHHHHHHHHHHNNNNNNSPYTHDAADWVSSTSKRSSLFIAEKTCEMICYLWFSSSLGPSSSRHRSARARRANATAASSSSPSSPRYHSLSNSRTATLQFSASRDFVQFMQKLLETTQVSQSVIVLSIYYIYRLKERNEFSVGQPGSEFRVAVVALMMANKFVDDNTYTNKTWSEVSGISLTELNKMEREFLQGVDFRLFVDESTYESWLNLLRGLVYAKERELQRWNDMSSACVRPLAAAVVAAERGQHTYSSRSRRVRHSRSDSSSYPSQRARSSSPQASHSYPFTFSVPQQAKSDMSHLQSQQQQQTLMTSSSACSPSTTQAHTATRPGSKRSAEDAFSPTSATFAGVVQAKRPTGLAVDTSVTSSLAAMTGAVVGSSPMVKSAYAAVGGSGVYADSLRGFERLSISSAVRTPASTTSGSSNQSLAQPSGLVAPAPSEYQQQHSESRHSRQGHVLAAPYRVCVDRQTVPDQLYFYALASSPMKGQGQAENVEDDEDVSMESSAQIAAGRKGHLRYSRPPTHAQVGQEIEPSLYEKRAATSVYSEYYNGGAQSQHQSSYGAVESSRSASHHHQAIGHGLPSTFTPGGAPHLPPLTQALSSYVHSQPLSQSNGQSSFQSGRDLPVPVQQTTPSYPSSVTTQRRFSVVPLMVQSARSSPLSNFSDYGHSHQQQARYAASPVHQYYPQTRHVSQTQSSSLPVESAAPAPFANAGPPGIQHFYAPLSSSRSNVKYYRQVGSGAASVQPHYHYHHHQHHHHHQQQQPMSSPFAIRV